MYNGWIITLGNIGVQAVSLLFFLTRVFLTWVVHCKVRLYPTSVCITLCRCVINMYYFLSRGPAKLNERFD
ncbi:hypothetical protein GGR54DRAFT_613787 [Hypoxylon sp. NC1633]|nr:hypothetical protein GGR54DRAFT_613787 [Hypoxylon sp. NC1633]